MLFDAERCRRCGTSEWEWQRRDGDHIVKVDPPPYVAEGYKCHGCAAKERVEAANDEVYKRTKAERFGARVGLFRPPAEEKDGE